MNTRLERSVEIGESSGTLASSLGKVSPANLYSDADTSCCGAIRNHPPRDENDYEYWQWIAMYWEDTIDES